MKPENLVMTASTHFNIWYLICLLYPISLFKEWSRVYFTTVLKNEKMIVPSLEV